MEKVMNVEIIYDQSDSMEILGKRELIQGYVKNGYHVTDERNGYWILFRPADVRVILENAACRKIFGVKKEVLAYYKSDKITDALIEQFMRDVHGGKISFQMNEDGSAYQMT